MNKELELLSIKLTNCHLFTLIYLQKISDLEGSQVANHFFSYYTDGVKRLLKTFLKFFCKKIDEKSKNLIREACKTTYEISETIESEEKLKHLLPENLVKISEQLGKLVHQKEYSFKTYSLSSSTGNSLMTDFGPRKLSKEKLLYRETGVRINLEDVKKKYRSGVKIRDEIVINSGIVKTEAKEERERTITSEFEIGNFGTGDDYFFEGEEIFGNFKEDESYSEDIVEILFREKEKLKIFERVFILHKDINLYLTRKYRFRVKQEVFDEVGLNQIDDSELELLLKNLKNFFDVENNLECFLMFFEKISKHKQFRLIKEGIESILNDFASLKDFVVLSKECELNYIKLVIETLISYQNGFLKNFKKFQKNFSLLENEHRVEDEVYSDYLRLEAEVEDQIRKFYTKTEIMNEEKFEKEKLEQEEILKKSFFMGKFKIEGFKKFYNFFYFQQSYKKLDIEGVCEEFKEITHINKDEQLNKRLKKKLFFFNLDEIYALKFSLVKEIFEICSEGGLHDRDYLTKEKIKISELNDFAKNLLIFEGKYLKEKLLENKVEKEKDIRFLILSKKLASKDFFDKALKFEKAEILLDNLYYLLALGEFRNEKKLKRNDFLHRFENLNFLKENPFFCNFKVCDVLELSDVIEKVIRGRMKLRRKSQYFKDVSISKKNG